MSLSLNQAQDIVQKLSNDQLMHAYTSGTVPQFVVFSEMQRRQNMANTQAKIPTQTVAEKMVGKPEHEGIAAMQAPPQMAAKGGITRSSPLDMGYSEDLPPEARKAIAMRIKAMQGLEEPMDFSAGGPVHYAEGSEDKPVTSSEIADMIIHPMIQTESNGRQFDSKGNPLRSRAGAFGIMQVKPDTGREAATKAGFAWEPNKFYNDPAYNTKVGRAYLVQMLDRFGDTEKALAAYNWGPGNLSAALEKAKSTGKDWKSFLPGETSAYLNKILGSRQDLLPPRQDPQGADTQEPAYQQPYMDPTLAGGKGSDPTIYNNVNQYPYRSNGLDSLSDSLNAARAVQKVKFSDGGIMLAGGNAGKTLADLDADNKIRQFAQIQKVISGQDANLYPVNPSAPQDYPLTDDDNERISREYETSIPGLSKQKPNSPLAQLERAQDKTKTGRYLSTEDGTKMEPTSSPVGRFFSGIGGFTGNIIPNIPNAAQIRQLQEKRDSLQIGPFTQETDAQRAERLSQIEQIDKQIEALANEKPSNAEDPRTVSSMNNSPVRGEGSAATEPPVPPQGIATVPGAMPPSGAPSGTGKGIPSAAAGQAGPGGASDKTPAGKAGVGDTGDSSFSSVFGQIKGAIGNGISEELASSKKEFEKNLASMKNDKIVDTLFAAAKTLASQRVGSVNYGDVVANAGLAAQEAQKRIYKAEDDLRKYRADLIKAQNDGDYKAATIAMSRINNEETNRKGLQTAMLQTSRLIQSQEASERKANIAAASKELTGLIHDRNVLEQKILNPQAFGIVDTKALEAERARLDSQIAAARSGLSYWQNGVSTSDVEAEMKRRGLI